MEFDKDGKINDEYLDYAGMYKFFVYIHSLMVNDDK